MLFIPRCTHRPLGLVQDDVIPASPRHVTLHVPGCVILAGSSLGFTLIANNPSLCLWYEQEIEAPGGYCSEGWEDVYSWVTNPPWWTKWYTVNKLNTCTSGVKSWQLSLEVAIQVKLL